MRSSYLKNNYEHLFSALVKIHRPQLIVELGVLDGFSILTMGVAAPEDCLIVGIDLFEDYKYTHGTKEKILEEAKQTPEIKIENFTLIKGDAITSAEIFEDQSIDIFHVDISNDGDNLQDVFEAWQNKIKSQTGLVIFEGGSKERDEIDWMKRYAKEPIRIFKENLLLDGNWELLTLSPFPSISLCRKVF